MKTFYTFISRVLLIIFTANCLLPSTSWAQRRPRRGVTTQNTQSLQDMLDGFQRGERIDRNKLLEDATTPVRTQRDVTRVAPVERVHNQILPKAEEQVFSYEQVQRAVLPNLTRTLEAYNNAVGKDKIAIALAQLHQDAKDLVAEQEQLLDVSNVLVQLEKTGQIPEQLRIPFRADGTEFLDNLGDYMTQDALANFSKVLEIADPVIYPNTHLQSRAYAAQILAQSAQQWANFEGNAVALDLLLRAQLRLARQMGYSFVPKNAAAQDKEVLSAMPANAADSSARGWSRMGLLYIHKLYQAWNVPDPLGLKMDTLEQDFLNEIKALRKKKLKEQSETFSALVTLSTFAVLFRIEKGGDLEEVVTWLDDNPQDHLTKRTKLNTPYTTIAQVVMSTIAQQIRFATDATQAGKLGNTLIKLADKTKYSVGVRLAALEALGDLRMEQMANKWKCKPGNVPPGMDLTGQCHKLVFTDKVRNYLAKQVLELYEPLNAIHFASVQDYGLDSAQMQAFAEELVVLYNKFALETIGQQLNYKRDGNGNLYNDNSALVVEDADGFLRNVFEGPDGYLVDRQNNRYDRQQVRLHRIYAPYAQPINAHKRNDEINLALAKIVGEAILWAVAFEAIGIVFRTLRGVYIALPNAARAVKAGEGVAGATAQIKQGVQLSNIMSSAGRAGISMQAVKVGAEEPVLIKNYRDLVNLSSQGGISSFNIFYGSKPMASLSVEGLTGLSSVPKLDIWKFISSNLVSPGTNLPIGLKALEGSPFSWFNPYLRQVASDVQMSRAVSYMARNGELDLWVGRIPAATEGPVADTDILWTNLRATRGQGNFLDDVLASGDRVQFAVTPRASALEANYFTSPLDFMAGSYGPGSALGGQQAVAASLPELGSPYIPRSQAEFLDLLREFGANPRAFGIRETNALNAFEALQSRYAALNGGRRFGSYGLWQQGAADLWSQTGQADVLFGHILQSNMPFRSFEMNMAIWGGLKGADDLVYKYGYGDWLTKTATREQNNEMQQTFPEYSAAQKEEEGTADTGNIMQRVIASGYPQTEGSLFGAPIVSLRYVAGSPIFALPESTKDLLRSAEANTRLENAANFTNVYMPLKTALADVKTIVAQDQEMVAQMTQYEAQLEQIKKSDVSYGEKARQAARVQEDFNYDVMTWSANVTIKNWASSKIFTSGQIAGYRHRVSDIIQSDADKAQKIAQLEALCSTINRDGLYYAYTNKEIFDAIVIKASKEGYRRSDFEDIFTNYLVKISNLRNNVQATGADFQRASDDLFQQVNERITQLANDPAFLRRVEIENTL